jgi:hydrogenase maturation protease
MKSRKPRIDADQYSRWLDVVNCPGILWKGMMSVPVAQRDQQDRTAAASVVVLGIGNVLLGDDGVGSRLVERLRAESEFAAATFIDGGTLSFSLLGFIETADAMLVADAAELDELPGTVRVFENEAMDRFLASSRRRSVHEVGLCDLLDMARLLDCVPRRRALLCVQPATIAWGQSLSPAVAAAFDAAAARAGSVLRNWREQ